MAECDKCSMNVMGIQRREWLGKFPWMWWYSHGGREKKKKKKEKILSEVEPGVSMGKGNKGGKLQGILRREVGFRSSALEQGENGR